MYIVNVSDRLKHSLLQICLISTFFVVSVFKKVAIYTSCLKKS